MTNPVSSNDPTPAVNLANLTSITTTTTTAPATTTDTLEASAVTSKHFSLLNYLASVDIPSLANQLQSYKNELATLEKSTEYYNYIADEMVNYQGNIEQLIQLDQLQQALVNMANELNKTISETFSQDQINMDNTQINALNDATQTYLAAVTAFENGDITQEEFDQAAQDYNTAVDAYNSYATTRNEQLQAYNTQADAYNAFLEENFDTINAGRSAAGLPPLTLEELQAPIVPLMPTVPNVPVGSVPDPLPTPVDYTPTAVQPIDTSSVTFGNSLFPPFSHSSALYLLFVNLTGLLASESTSPSAQRVIKELFNSDVSAAGLPDAYIEQNVSHQFSALLNQTAPIATGGGSYQFPYDLANNLLQGGVSSSAYNEIDRSLSNYFPGEVATGGATGIAALVRAVIHYSASGAIPPTVNTLNQVAIQRGVVGQNLSASLLSIEILRKVVADVGAGALNAPVATIIRNSAAKANVALTPDQINNGIPAAIASANLAALNTSLAILAGTLKAPTIPEKVYNQVLADLKATPAQAAVITSPNNRNINTVLRNPTNTILLQQSLLAQTNALNIPAAQAIPSIAKAAQAIVSAVPYNTPAELSAQASAAFTAQNFTKTQAAQLANQTTQFVHNEITAPNLNAPLNPATISPNQLPNLPPETLATALKAPTVRAFRDYLTSQLVANGLPLAQAQTQAQNAVLSISPTPPYAPANVNQEVLQASLAASLNNVVKNPVATAASVTNAALTTVPPPATPEILRSNINNALQTQVEVQVARRIAANAFITTSKTALNNEELNRQSVKREIIASLERQSRLNHEQIAEGVVQDLLAHDRSIRDLIRYNILNPNPPKQQQDVPILVEPLYQQIQHTLNTNQVVYDSTDAQALTASVMMANPSFGVPREAIDFPIQSNTRV